MFHSVVCVPHDSVRKILFRGLFSGIYQPVFMVGDINKGIEPQHDTLF